MLKVTLPNGSIVFTDTLRSVFDGLGCVIEDSDFIIGDLSYNYLDPLYDRQYKV